MAQQLVLLEKVKKTIEILADNNATMSHYYLLLLLYKVAPWVQGKSLIFLSISNSTTSVGTLCCMNEWQYTPKRRASMIVCISQGNIIWEEWWWWFSDIQRVVKWKIFKLYIRTFPCSSSGQNHIHLVKVIGKSI